MKTLYERYDDITASEAFKQRMVRTLQSEVRETSGEKVVRMPAKGNNVVRLPMKKKTVAILIAAAVLMVLTVGTAVAAAAGVFTPNKKFSTPEDYTLWSKEEREQYGLAVPDVENAIEAAKPEGEDYSIKMLPELDNAKELNTMRQEKGQPAYSEEDWGWIREIKPEIEEALVDGNIWSFNIRLNTDHGSDFVSYASSFEKDENGDPIYPGNKQYVGAMCDGAFFTIGDSKNAFHMPGYGTGVPPQSITEDGCTLRTEWNIQDSESYRLNWGAESDSPLPTEGKIHFTMIIKILDCRVDDIYGTLGEIRYTFTFEAVAGKDAEKQIVNERPLSGSIVLTMLDFDNGTRHNEVVSLDGVVLEETLKYRSTGLAVEYKIKTAPVGWVRKYAESMMWPYNAMSVVCIPEDEEAKDSILHTSEVGIPDGKYVGILPIFPSDYEAVRGTHYKVQLIVDRIASFNGEEADENWVMEKAPGMTYSETLYYASITYDHQVIAEFDLPMP